MTSSRPTLRKTIEYPHPPEKVWVALTDPRAMAEWLMPNDFKPVVGHRFRFEVDPSWWFSGVTECEVLEVDPPRRLVYSWQIVPKSPGAARHEPMIITWQLEPVDAGTRVVFTQTGIDAIPRTSRWMMTFGWGTMLKRWIPKVLERVADDHTFTPGAIPLHRRCYKTRTLSDDLVF